MISRPKCLPPYFHPTTVCFVDDNEAFLRSVELDMPPHIPYRGFLNPDEALAAVNATPPRPTLAQRCFSPVASHPDGSVIRFDLATLEQEITDLDRFARFSVLMVDYAMPQMNGLEFCAKVVDTDAKRVLLTGVADESTAVQAFNDGLIDLYLPKAELTEPGKLQPIIQSLQNAYFQQYTPRLTSNLSRNPPAFMQDAEIVRMFYELVATHDIVEYFLVDDPPGYLLLQADGRTLRLILTGAQDLERQLALAERHGAPKKWQRRLKAGKAIAWLYENPEDYAEGEPYPWRDVMFTAQRIAGAQTWFAALVNEPPADIDFDPQRSSFAEYLRTRAA